LNCAGRPVRCCAGRNTMSKRHAASGEIVSWREDGIQARLRPRASEDRVSITLGCIHTRHNPTRHVSRRNDQLDEAA